MGSCRGGEAFSYGIGDLHGGRPAAEADDQIRQLAVSRTDPLPVESSRKVSIATRAVRLLPSTKG
jgi:hypothetical protein